MKQQRKSGKRWEKNGRKRSNFLIFFIVFATEKVKIRQRMFVLNQPQKPAIDGSDINALTDEELFRYINNVIVAERLFLDPKFDRQTVMDRFRLSKERISVSTSACRPQTSERTPASEVTPQRLLDHERPEHSSTTNYNDFTNSRRSPLVPTGPRMALPSLTRGGVGSVTK